jgi:hypothetical protein
MKNILLKLSVLTMVSLSYAAVAHAQCPVALVVDNPQLKAKYNWDAW